MYEKNDYDEECLQHLNIFKILIDKNESLWNNYQTRKSKSRTTFLNDLLSRYEKQTILKANTTLYRARAIDANNQNEVVAFSKAMDCLNEIRERAKQSCSARQNKELSNENLVLLASQSTDKELNLPVEKISGLFEEDFGGFPKEKCSCPPLECRKEGRLNTKEDEYLYLSKNVKTTLYEIRPLNFHFYSIAQCKTIKNLKMFDLTFHSMEKMDTSNDLFEDKTVIARKISEPNTNDDKRFYSITQELAHIIQSKGYDGIKYDSAMGKRGINFLLFDKNNVEFISSKVIEVNNIRFRIKDIIEKSEE